MNLNVQYTNSMEGLLVLLRYGAWVTSNKRINVWDQDHTELPNNPTSSFSFRQKYWEFRTKQNIENIKNKIHGQPYLCLFKICEFQWLRNYPFSFQWVMSGIRYAYFQPATLRFLLASSNCHQSWRIYWCDFKSFNKVYMSQNEFWTIYSLIIWTVVHILSPWTWYLTHQSDSDPKDSIGFQSIIWSSNGNLSAQY